VRPCLPGKWVSVVVCLLALEESCREEALRDGLYWLGSIGVATLLVLFLRVVFRGRLIGNRISNSLYDFFSHFAFLPFFPPTYCPFLGSSTSLCV
jgi:hypothetical protein